ncbi:MAG: hypothetical protein JWN46_370 [Acidimicrobiales bacterium]|nr:hypothetical protein [Acidimicrobiales bacterium]
MGAVLLCDGTAGEPEPVPWCDTCSRFYNPNSVAPDGTCVKCGNLIAEPPSDDDERPQRVPWHFWLMLVALVVYLGWRLVQGIQWLLH